MRNMGPTYVNSNLEHPSKIFGITQKSLMIVHFMFVHLPQLNQWILWTCYPCLQTQFIKSCATFMLNIFGRTIYSNLRLFPIVDRQQIQTYRDDVVSGHYHFVMQSFYAMSSTWFYRRKKQAPSAVPLPEEFSKRAHSLVSKLFDDSPSLSLACGLIMLAMADCGDVRGKSWILSGIATRVCQDIGLHLDLSAHPIRCQFEPVQLIRAKLTWCCCYYLDKMQSITLGRPQSIHDFDCIRFQKQKPIFPFEHFMDSPHEPDFDFPVVGDFLYVLQLSHIQGRLCLFSNSCSDACEFHAIMNLTIAWNQSLPTHLRMPSSFINVSPQLINLHIMYLFTLLLAYQPCFNPVFPDKMAMHTYGPHCIQAIKTVVKLLEAARNSNCLNALSLYAMHAVLSSGSLLFCIYKTKIQTSLSEIIELYAEIVDFAELMLPDWPMTQTIFDLNAKIFCKLCNDHPEYTNNVRFTPSNTKMWPSLKEEYKEYPEFTQTYYSDYDNYLDETDKSYYLPVDLNYDNYESPNTYEIWSQMPLQDFWNS